MGNEMACRACHGITTADECPHCHGDDLSNDYLGYVIVLDVDQSWIAAKMGIDEPGKYALKVR